MTTTPPMKAMLLYLWKHPKKAGFTGKQLAGVLDTCSSEAGAHRTAAALVRSGFVERVRERGEPVRYRITDRGKRRAELLAPIPQ